MEASQDQITEIEKSHQEKIYELDAQIQDKESINQKLNGELTVEKMQSTKLEEQRSDLLKKYEEEKATW